MEPTCMKTLHSTANFDELGLFFKGEVHSKMADFFLFPKKRLYKGRLLTKISASKELIILFEIRISQGCRKNFRI